MKYSHCFVLTAALLAFVSCIEVETELSFASADSGSLKVSYAIDSRALQIGMFDDGATILPLPLHQRDFEQTAATHPQLELRSYHRAGGNGVTRIDAEYRFESLAALQTALGSRTTVILDATPQGTWFKHALFEGHGGGQRSQEFVDEFLADASFSMTVHAPGPVISSSIGQIDGRLVRLHYTARELLVMEEPLILELVWQ
ncbi:MAG: hypothetical protein EA384_02110 [Spirochaetaceae bacterium]|nr:MAG: hypothetical protein EA384_02110 [Spirochaetaceae bacterium]